MMTEKVYGFITDNHLLSAGDTVVCGLSGGADSVALLISLSEQRERLDISVEALHVNHCLRGDESDRDERFCRELCGRLEIPFNAVSCNVRELSRSEGLSVEEAARKMRYGVFGRFSHGKKIATAHNANDNLETVILNLSRGTGIKGLAGIPAVRGNIIRPLLAVTRCEIEDFLAERSQEYVTDSTNLSDDYTRNRIRHNIIPLLAGLNSSVIETSVNTIRTLREENRFIDELTDNAVKNCRRENVFSGLRDYPAVIRKRSISRLLSDNALPYCHARLEEADDILMNGGKLNISRDFFLIGKDGNLSLEKIVQANETICETLLKTGENVIFENCFLLCEQIECDNLKKNEAVHKNSTFYLMDYDKIKGQCIIRNRKYGDRIKLTGRNFTSSVKKLINEKISPEIRPTLHFIEDGEGTIFAEGIGIAERVAPDDNTVRFLRISVKRL